MSKNYPEIKDQEIIFSQDEILAMIDNINDVKSRAFNKNYGHTLKKKLKTVSATPDWAVKNKYVSKSCRQTKTSFLKITGYCRFFKCPLTWVLEGKRPYGLVSTLSFVEQCNQCIHLTLERSGQIRGIERQKLKQELQNNTASKVYKDKFGKLSASELGSGIRSMTGTSFSVMQKIRSEAICSNREAPNVCKSLQLIALKQVHTDRKESQKNGQLEARKFFGFIQGTIISLGLDTCTKKYTKTQSQHRVDTEHTEAHRGTQTKATQKY